MMSVALPSYQEVKEGNPLTTPGYQFIEASRQTVRRILRGEDPRLLLIFGPCSIHERQSALEFAQRIRQLPDALSSVFFPIMRVYCEKPRTLSGWTGFIYDPLLNGSSQLQLGIEWTRQLLLDLASLHVPAGTEFLDPLLAPYYDDLITWGCIGARTSASPLHRQLASALPMPIGFKNGIAGDTAPAIHGVAVATSPLAYTALSDQGHFVYKISHGNRDTHLVLRGGENGPNYDQASVAAASTALRALHLPVRVVIDCSHHNSGKDLNRQVIAFQSVIEQARYPASPIRGLMLESHLYRGNQSLSADSSSLQYGVSITDPCLDWDTTVDLISWAHSAHQSLYSVSFC